MKIISFQNLKHGYLLQYLMKQLALKGIFFLIIIEIMSAVTLNLSSDSILIKLLFRFVNFEEIKK